MLLLKRNTSDDLHLPLSLSLPLFKAVVVSNHMQLFSQEAFYTFEREVSEKINTAN